MRFIENCNFLMGELQKNPIILKLPLFIGGSIIKKYVFLA